MKSSNPSTSDPLKEYALDLDYKSRKEYQIRPNREKLVHYDPKSPRIEHEHAILEVISALISMSNWCLEHPKDCQPKHDLRPYASAKFVRHWHTNIMNKTASKNGNRTINPHIIPVKIKIVDGSLAAIVRQELKAEIIDPSTTKQSLDAAIAKKHVVSQTVEYTVIIEETKVGKVLVVDSATVLDRN